MNKTELKNFAIFARRNLLEKVTLRAKLFGIDEKNGLEMREEFGQLYVNGHPYELKMKSAFQSLAKQLKVKGYKQLIEEVAYTWFNRIIAIRYMEVNDYLPERVNVLSSSTGKTEPDILSQFETMDLDIDVAEIKDLINQGEIEKAYRKLFIAQCNALHKILPFLFEKINDYTELLLPDVYCKIKVQRCAKFLCKWLCSGALHGGAAVITCLDLPNLLQLAAWQKNHDCRGSMSSP
ncbi:hypothetical protein [Parageobacillus thermoglucosidasius]|uniref:hypothetical protein n=1 Tax=Parageobacillus thermoglucosidasius TaxID=1426 RepID=UPI00242BC0AC|nr:hypothetical protein [Parageobacillus thermoglucosidasius]